MSENMVERMAKAIAEVLTRDRPHPVSGRPYCLLIVEDEDAREMARAAIEAMRNPTAEMLYFGTGNKQAIETWNLMIDGALRK